MGSPRTGVSGPTPDTLHELDDTGFERFVRSLAGAMWDGWATDVSPPSPDRSIDVRLSRAEGRPIEGPEPDERRLFHAKQRPAGSPVGAPAVRELATIREHRDLGGVTLATTSDVSDPARALAAERGVGVLDGDALCRLCVELGVEVPDAAETVDAEPTGLDADATDVADVGTVDGADTGRDAAGPEALEDRDAEIDAAPEFYRAIETHAAHWPAPLRERAEWILTAVDGLAAFDHEVAAGDASTVVSFVPEDGAQPVVKARLGETTFLVSVRTPAGEFESVVRLSVHRESQPALAGVLADLEPRIERALEEVT